MRSKSINPHALVDESEDDFATLEAYFHDEVLRYAGVTTNTNTINTNTINSNSNTNAVPGSTSNNTHTSNNNNNTLTSNAPVDYRERDLPDDVLSPLHVDTRHSRMV